MMSGFPVSLDLVALKATLILVGAMLVAFALRRASGNSRHTLWTATTLALLALPVLESNLPQLPLAWLPAAPAVELVAGVPTLAAATSGGSNAFAPAAADQLVELTATSQGAAPFAIPRGIGFWIGITWLVGVIGFAAPVLLGLVRSRRVMANARDVKDDRVQDHFAHATRLVGVPVPVALRISPDVRTPMTGGIVHPVVLLPESALMWSDDCLAAVLRHELVHVRQRDALRQLGARLSVALYWFHPLAWRAARLGALAREMACDESVLRLGTRPSRYARHLLALADPLPAPVAPALVRLDHPHLEERVMAILRASPPPASRRLSVSAALLIFTWTAVVAAASPTVRQAVAEERGNASAPEHLASLDPLPELGAELEMPLEGFGALEELPAVPALDCEPSRDSRARSVSGNGRPVRMFTTEHEGTRICVTVRGDDTDRDGFIPRGRLPNGVVLTMATSNNDGDRHLEIEGTGNGNVHRWTVDGRSRPFDGEAAEWRDAMLELIGVLTERSVAEREMAVEAMGVARRNMEAASADMRRTMVAEGRAAARASADHEVAARVAERLHEQSARGFNTERPLRAPAAIRARELEAVGHAMERNAEAMAEVAETRARVAADVAHRADEVRATSVGRGTGGRAMVAPRAAGGGRQVTPPRASAAPRSRDVSELRARELERAHEFTRESLEEHRRAIEERQGDLREHADELREHAADMAREHERMAEDLRSERRVLAPRGVGVGGVDAPIAPRVPRVMRTPPAPPAVADRDQDPRAVDANQRLRAAIRATGETCGA